MQRKMLGFAARLAALVALARADVAAAGPAQTVVTAQLELEFRDGWLTRWKNKLTDEELRFGAGPAVAEARGSEFLKYDESAAALTQAGAAGWSLRVARDQAQLVHAAPGTQAQRYVLLQGRTGGLLILLDDPALERSATLERNDARAATTLTWQSGGLAADQNPARWLIRQYIGEANWGAQYWLDYLARARALTPADQRPTGWAQQVACVVADPPWCRPVTNNDVAWDRSMAIHRAWLDNLQRVVDPEKLLFVVSDWAAAGGAPDPYFTQMAGPARHAGYHVALRLPPWALLGTNNTAVSRASGEYVGAALAAVRATVADAVLLDFAPPAPLGAQREMLKRLRLTLNQNGLTQVALGVAGEASEGVLPLVDFQGVGPAAGGVFARGLRTPPVADAAAMAALLRANAPLPVRLSLAALLTEEEIQSFGLPPRAPTRPFTRFHYGVFALARFWGELQPRLLEPKRFEPGDLVRYQLNDGRVLRLLAADAQTLRLAFAQGDVLADLSLADGWKNNAALLEKYGPVFLRDLTAP